MLGLVALVVAVGVGLYVANCHDDGLRHLAPAIGVTAVAAVITLLTWPGHLAFMLVKLPFSSLRHHLAWDVTILLLVAVHLLFVYQHWLNRQTLRRENEQLRARR
jgi:hypothetical protein